MGEIVHVDGQEQHRVKGVVERATSCIVATEEDMGWASDDLATLRTIRKEFEAKWDSLKEPLNEGLKRLKAEFEPYVAQLKAAEATVASKILECKRKLQAEADKAKREREEADRKAREAAAKANMPPPPPKPVTTAEQAPRPWTNRQAIKVSMSGARAHPMLPNPNRARPKNSGGLRPKRSDNGP